MSILSEDEIADNASPTLANIRRQIRNAQESIKDKLNDIIRSSRYQKYIQEPIVTLRGDRYVIPVKQEYRTEIPGLIHDSSASGATILLSLWRLWRPTTTYGSLKLKSRLKLRKYWGN